MRIAYKEQAAHSFWHVEDVDGRYVHAVDSAVYIGNFDYTLFNSERLDHHGYPTKEDKLIEIPKGWDKVDTFFEVPADFPAAVYPETVLFDRLKAYKEITAA